MEGTVFEPNSPRLVSVRGVDVEAPLGGTMLIIANDDQPGVIGEVGTILGRHGVNIANFALGRGETGAIGVVNVDEDADAPRRARRGRRGTPARAGDPRSVAGSSDGLNVRTGSRSRHDILTFLSRSTCTATLQRARMDARVEPRPALTGSPST